MASFPARTRPLSRYAGGICRRVSREEQAARPRGDSKVRPERERERAVRASLTATRPAVPGPVHGVQSPLGLGDSGGVLDPGFLPLMEEGPRVPSL